MVDLLPPVDAEPDDGPDEDVGADNEELRSEEPFEEGVLFEDPFLRRRSSRLSRIRLGSVLRIPTTTPRAKVRIRTRAAEPCVSRNRRFTSTGCGFWRANTTATTDSTRDRTRAKRMRKRRLEKRVHRERGPSTRRL